MSTNVLARFVSTVEHLGSQTAVQRYKGKRWESLTWKQYGDYVLQLAHSLKSLGLAPGDRAVIWSSTRFEWAVSDLATMALGGVVVPVYDTTTIEEIEFIVRETEPKNPRSSSAKRLQNLNPYNPSCCDLV
jgi:long-chain acyl-CoA synthetase